ncbi:MAG: metal-sensing transcriptional repressor [Hydrogeniiclostridium mannosilyticum]
MKADKAKVARLLKTARGQIDGVLKMIDGDQYCIDIANQIMAAEAVLQRAIRRLSGRIWSAAFWRRPSGDEEERVKIDEIAAVLDKLARWRC